MRDLASAAAQAARMLERAGAVRDTATRDAALLARHAVGWTAETWLIRQREPVTESFRQSFDALIARRAMGEPIAYLTGEREFYGRPFRVTPAVLIPRPETELLIDAALARVPDRRATPIVVDVGTGSGCLAVTLALERPHARVVATDVSGAALEIARANAETLGAGSRIDFRQASLLDGIGRADLVVSNPPYVAARDRASLSREVVDFEPAQALFGGADGLEIIGQLLPDVSRVLVPDGWLVMEIGAGQADAIAQLFAGVPTLTLLEIRRDLQQIPRCAIARRV